MSKHFDKLLKMLKTRQEVTALGFSKDEIQSLATDLDKNLNIEDNAADDDVENTINNAIETVIPVLKLAQASSSRIVSKFKKEWEDEKQKAEEEAAAQKAKEEEERKKAEEEAKKTAPKPEEQEDKKYDELKDMLSKLTEKMSSQDETIKKQNETITNLLRGNVREKRKAVLEEKLKDAGTIGKTIRRAFEKSEFKDDSEFDSFLAQVDEDLKDYEQDIANRKLANERNIPDPDKNPDGTPKQVEVMSDEDIDALADIS